MSNAACSSSITIRNNLIPGDIGYITWLHGILYAREQGWDFTFEAYVAGPLSEFAKISSPRQRIWIAEKEGRIVGSTAIVEAAPHEAQLRWLLVDPSVRGLGLGKKLVHEAIDFSKAQDYRKIFLWTVSALSTAAVLYRSCGFKKTEETSTKGWGAPVLEERYDLDL